MSHQFFLGQCPLELAQGPARVALAWHKARGSTPFGVTVHLQFAMLLLAPFCLVLLLAFSCVFAFSCLVFLLVLSCCASFCMVLLLVCFFCFCLAAFVCVCAPFPQSINARSKSSASILSWGHAGCHSIASQRSLHNAPIFRLLLKVAVNGTHQCESLNFCGALRPNSASLILLR